MRTNKPSIGGLIGVHVSSIVQKHQNAKETIFTLLEVFVRAKTFAFVVFGSLIFVLLVGFGLIYVFVRSKSFCKTKKINWLEIVLITSHTILLATGKKFYRKTIISSFNSIIWFNFISFTSYKNSRKLPIEEFIFQVRNLQLSKQKPIKQEYLQNADFSYLLSKFLQQF